MRILLGVLLLLATNLSTVQAVQIRGTVLAPDGAPVANALVIAAENAVFAPVETDAQGVFVLENAPEGGTLIFAARGKDFAQGTAQNGEVKLHLTPPGVLVPAMRRQLFEQFNLLLDGVRQIEPSWPLLGSDKMLALALQRDGALPPGGIETEGANWDRAGDATLRMLENSARNDPSWLRQKGAPLLAKIGGGTARFGAEAALASVRAFGDAQQRAAAQQWLNGVVKLKDTPQAPLENATRWFYLAGIAGALDDPRAQGFTLSALTFADQAGQPAIDTWDAKWGGALALGGPRLLALLEAEWPLSACLNALCGGVKALAPLNVQRARALLPTVQRVEMQLHTSKPGTPSPRLKFGGLANIESFIQIQEALADPTKFWDKYEHSGTSSNFWPMLVAREAERRGDHALALRALRSLDDPGGGGSSMSTPAALAEIYDKPLAARLWKMAEKRALEVVAESHASGRIMSFGDVSDYCVHLASFDPARARLLLESVWPRPNDAAKNATRIYAGHVDLAFAMFALDPLRATNMLQESASEFQDTVRAKIIVYLMADEAERCCLPYD